MTAWFDPANITLLLNLDTSHYTSKDEDERND